jgi:hypothetical protein
MLCLMCRAAAAILLLSFPLTLFGCGGKISVQGISDSESALYRRSAAEDTEPVAVRSVEF